MTTARDESLHSNALARLDVARPDVAPLDVVRSDVARSDVARSDVARSDVARSDVARSDDRSSMRTAMALHRGMDSERPATKVHVSAPTSIGTC